MNLYPRETLEFQPVTVEVNGVALTVADVADVELCVTGPRDRPVTWVAPTVLDDAFGVLIEDYTPGTYLVWARVTSFPETPVLEAGSFRIT